MDRDRGPTVSPVCTVVIERSAAGAGRILALRDELTGRAFDEPARWWPEHQSFVGGRDRSAGGSWCVTDVDSGVTALVLNRTERRTGTPSRGLLPITAVSAGEAWPDELDHRSMASFTLLLDTPSSLVSWSWDAEVLRRVELGPGLHMATPSGVDTRDAREVAFAPRFAREPWRDVVAGQRPRDDPGALVVRHDVEAGVWATVFGQLITARPGELDVEWTRTPWRAETWEHHHFT